MSKQKPNAKQVVEQSQLAKTVRDMRTEALLLMYFGKINRPQKHDKQSVRAYNAAVKLWSQVEPRFYASENDEGIHEAFEAMSKSFATKQIWTNPASISTLSEAARAIFVPIRTKEIDAPEAEACLESVRAHWQRRVAVDSVTLLNDYIQKKGRKYDHNEMTALFEKYLVEIRGATNSKDSVMDIDGLEKCFKKGQKNKGKDRVCSGIKDFDDMNGGGFRRGSVVVFASGSGCGKSTLAQNTIMRQFWSGKSVAYFSIEMESEDLANRLVADRANIKISDIENGTLSDIDRKRIKTEFARMRDFAHENKNKITMIVPHRAGTIESILSRFEGMGYDSICLDYLGLIDDSFSKKQKYENLDHIVVACKNFAKRNKCIVILPAQLNREGILAGSDGIERSADNVWRWTRDDLMSTVDSGVQIVDIEQRKNRRGSNSFNLRVCAELDYSRIRSATPAELGAFDTEQMNKETDPTSKKKKQSGKRPKHAGLDDNDWSNT